MGEIFVVRQSDLKLFSECALKWKYQNIDGLRRTQSGATIFGSIIHDCVLQLETGTPVETVVLEFCAMWDNPEAYNDKFEDNMRIDYYLRATNWKKYREEGIRIIRTWWDIIQWESDIVLAREHTFDVPIGDGHVLHGTADKVALRYLPKANTRAVLISDYKTGRKEPTYDYLNDDIQFTAYSYASTQPEFWAGIQNGAALFEELADAPRSTEWVHLRTPKRKDAGEREQYHYNRLIMAVNEMARSVAAGIFVPTISGESCRYCEFREQCGLPELDEDGRPLEQAE